MSIAVKRNLGFVLNAHAPWLVCDSAKHPFGPTSRLLQMKGCQLSYIGYTC